MADTEEIIELIHLGNITDHFKEHKLNVNIQGILHVYGKLTGLNKFNAGTTYYEKKIINSILKNHNLPTIK